jgi:hypothetical protein
MQTGTGRHAAAFAKWLPVPVVPAELYEPYLLSL